MSSEHWRIRWTETGTDLDGRTIRAAVGAPDETTATIELGDQVAYLDRHTTLRVSTGLAVAVEEAKPGTASGADRGGLPVHIVIEPVTGELTEIRVDQQVGRFHTAREATGLLTGMRVVIEHGLRAAGEL